MSSLAPLSSSSTGVQSGDSSVESGHIAAIIVCMLLGLIVFIYATYRLAKRYCPNMLLAITPQDTHPTLTRSASKQQVNSNEYEQQAAEMAAHMASADKQQQAAGKKADSHVMDIEPAASPLSINEQWTVRDEAAHDEDTA